MRRLNGLSYSPTAGFNGAASLQISTNDQGNTGSGGAQSDTDTVNITVNAVNDAPVVNTSGGSANYIENTPTIVDPALTLSDVDDTTLESATVGITGNFVAGQDTLLFTDQSGITGNFSSATGVLTLTGTATVAQYQAALRSVLYDNASDNPNTAARTVTFVVNDGALGSLPAARNVTLQAVNDAPVNTVPGAQTTAEDTALVFSNANGNAINIGDVDAGVSPLQVTLTATNGTLTLSALAGLSFTSGDGTADATMTFTGTMANINAALNGLSFLPTAGFDGAATVQVTANDQGNTGSGGVQSDTDTVNITVGAVNDPPSVNTSGGSANYIENTPTIVDPALTLSDIDDTHLESATVTITGNFVAGQDALLFTDQSGITGNFSGATGVLTLTGTATVAQYQAALRSVQYDNTSDNPNTATRTITFVVNDGSLSSSPDARDVTLQAVNDAPVNTVPGPQATAEDTALIFSSGNGNPILVDDPDIGTSLVEVTLAATNGTISLSQLTGLSFTTGGGTGDTVMTFTGTTADINAALNGLLFDPAAGFNGAASLQIVTNDQGNTGSGGPQSDSDTINITVNAVNDAPLNSVPGPQSTNEDSALVFSTAGGNLISISDVDAASNPLQVTLTATNGTITLSQTTGLMFTAGDGVADAVMTFTGTLTDLNAALDGLSFLSAANFSGAAGLQIVTNDQGNTGVGGPVSDTDNVNITVNAVNDAPVNSVPAPQTTNEDTTLVFSSAGGNLISINDVDAAGNPLQVTLTATNGTISLSQLTGLSFTTGDGVGDATMTFTGTLADLNAALDGLSFAPTANFNGAASLQITTNDQGNTGSGGPQSDSDTINITVNPVNDPPVVNTSGGSANYIENTPTIVDPALTLSDIDDTHLESATVTITGNLVAGQDMLLFTDQSGITGNFSGATGMLTLTGTATVAQYQAALRSVQYNNTSDNPNTATRTIAFVVNDGAIDSVAATRNVTLQAVNDIPINSVPGAQTTNEDTALVFSSAGGNLISVGDVDVAGNPLQVTLTAANGTISLSQLNGLSFTTGDGVGDAVMTFTGTLADLNAALDGLSFAPTADFNGAATIQIATNDQGNTGSGGPQSDTDTVNITVNPVNDAPIVVTSGGSANYIENIPAIVDPGLTLSDIDDSHLESATVTITGNFVAGQDTLLFTDQSGITGNYNGATGMLTLTGTATVAQYQAALRSVEYNNLSDEPNTTTRTIAFVVNDGSIDSLAAARNVTLQAVNDAPAHSVPAPQTTNEDTTLVFSTAGGNLISVGDVDAAGNPLQVTLAATNGTFSLSQTTGLNFTAGDGVADAVMTFTGTLADLNAALDGLSFLSAANFNGAASLQITTNDQGNTGLGGPLSDSDTVNITVNPVNDAPVNSVPAPQTTNEDNALVFSTADGNAISISDLDAAANPLQVTLTATNGTISLSQLNGLSFTTGDGVGDAVMTFTGTLADLNAALDGLSFAPTADFNGAASLQITTNDQGNTGLGGPLTDSDTVNITVNPVNDAPVVVTSGGSANYIENTPTIIDPALMLSDIDDTHLESATVTITGNFVAGQDTLLFTDQSGITGNWNGATGVLTLTGTATVAQYQAALRSVQYNNLSDDPNTATRTIAFVVNDGGLDSLAATRNVTVQAVNDAPVNTVPGPQTTNEDTTLVFSNAGGNRISVGDVDAAGNPLQVTLTATNGTITLSQTTGLSFNAGDGVADAVMTFTGTLADLNAALDGLSFSAYSQLQRRSQLADHHQRSGQHRRGRSAVG